jgi:hypothetical protein
LGQAVADTLRALRLRPEHAALAELARELARHMDSSSSVTTLAKLSPRLAGVLRELGATPATGRRPGGEDDGDGDDPAGDELAELEGNVGTRADRAAGMDPAAP